MDSVEVRLLGPLLVRRADGSVVGAEEWRSNKTLDLLRLLALNSGRPMSVATVVDRFWPSVDRDHGRASLRTAWVHASIQRLIVSPLPFLTS